MIVDRATINIFIFFKWREKINNLNFPALNLVKNVTEVLF